MNCIHCNEPGAHPGTRKCTDLEACHGRQEYARGVEDERARVAELEAAANTAGADASAAALRAMARATKAEAERDGWRKEANRWPELLAQAVAERDALKLEVESLARDMVAMTATANAEVAAGLAMAAERDALRAQVEALWRVRDMLQTALRDNSAAHSETGKALLRAEAQVGAARTYARQALDYGEDCDATDLLAAMDEAKP